jgi:membrane protease YdiL (CAAX protease family)
VKNTFLTLWIAGLVGTILALPYVFTLEQKVIAASPMPASLLALISVVQSSLLLAAAVYFGLRLARSIGLPVLTLIGSGTPTREDVMRMLKLSVPLGIATGAAIKFIDLFFAPFIRQIEDTVAHISFWKALLVAPYGGIVEELLMRLFLLTLFAWLLSKITRTTDPTRSSPIMWSAIIIAAILFGLGHLPATAAMTALTPLVLARAIILNGIGGLVFGWLYWRRGLEHAMAAHFTADIVLHAIPALFL